jgi:hypothetical protein
MKFNINDKVKIKHFSENEYNTIKILHLTFSSYRSYLNNTDTYFDKEGILTRYDSSKNKFKYTVNFGKGDINNFMEIEMERIFNLSDKIRTLKKLRN